MDEAILQGAVNGVPAQSVLNRDFHSDELIRSEQLRIINCREASRKVFENCKRSVNVEPTENLLKIKELKKEFYHFKQWSYTLEYEITIYLKVKKTTKSEYMKLITEARLDIVREAQDNTEALLKELKNNFYVARVELNENLVTKESCKDPSKKKEIIRNFIRGIVKRLGDIPPEYEEEIKLEVQDLNELIQYGEIKNNDSIFEELAELKQVESRCRHYGNNQMIDVPYCIVCSE
jgi:hypothetical protein